MKRNINFKNVLCMAAITLVTGMLGGCEDNSIATPVGKLPNETALDNNFGMLKGDMTTSDLEITMTNTKTPDFAFFYQTVKPAPMLYSGSIRLLRLRPIAQRKG